MFQVKLGAAGAALLAAQRWARLKMLDLEDCGLGDAGLAALARGAWPALESLNLEDNVFDSEGWLVLDDAPRWAPALKELKHRGIDHDHDCFDDSSD